jgi:O-antigen ligase
LLQPEEDEVVPPMRQPGDWEWAAGQHPAWASDVRWLCGAAAILLLLMYVSYAYDLWVGLGLVGALCFLVWFAVVFPQARRAAISAVHGIEGLQFIVLILVLSVYIGDFFPNVSIRDWQTVRDAPANAVNLLRSALIALAGLSAIRIAYLRSAGLALNLRDPFRWMILYAAVAIASSSYASLPAISAAKGAEVMVDVVCFLVLTPLFYAEDFLRSWNMLWSVITVMLVSVWVSALLLPSIGFEDLHRAGALFRALVGVYPTIGADGLGQLGASLAIVALCRLLRPDFHQRSKKKVFWTSLCLLGIATLAAAEARTSMIAFAFAVITCLYLFRRLTFLTSLGLTSIAVLVGAYKSVIDAIGANDIISQYVLRGQDSQLVYSLSGRFDYWQVAWNLFWASPFLGHGFYTAHRIDLNALAGRFDLSTVDNTYLEVLLGIGIVGLFPLFMAIGVLSRRMIQTLKRPLRSRGLRYGQIEMVGVLIIALTRSMTGPTFQVHGENLVSFLIVMAFVQSIYTNRFSRPAAIPRASVVHQRLLS